MSTSVTLSTGITVEPLAERAWPEATDILTDAFQHDPWIRSLFPGNTREDSRPFFRYLLRKSALMNEMLLGLKLDGKWVGVACVELPNAPKPGFWQWMAFLYWSLRLPFEISWSGFMLLNRYMRATTAFRPSERHHYLIFVGVNGRYQGRGLGRLFLNHIHGLVEENPHSKGIYLDTENPRNVALYDRFGYKEIGEESLGPFSIFGMYRPRMQ